MLETTVIVVNRLGLHARAAAQLVKLANGFRCYIEITLPRSNSTANAKSILSLLGLAAGQSSELVLRADGEDEEDALEAIRRIFAEGFGELS